MGEEIFAKLRYCFTAGYTLPQYCIDKGIKNPLFVSEKRFELFLWEILYQFRYDKRLIPRFCFTDGDEVLMKSYAQDAFEATLHVKKFSEMNLNAFDKIFFLTAEKNVKRDKNIVNLAELERFFILRTHIEIPLLHFLQRHPKVKLFLTKIPTNINRYDGGAEFAKNLTNTLLLGRQLEKNSGEKIATPLDKFGYNNQEVHDLIFIATKGVKTNLDGSTFMNDTDDPLTKIINGKRMTAYQPEKFLNRIFFIGPCHYMCSYAPYDKTIESYLQKMLNEANLPYRVENEGQPYVGRFQDIFYNLDGLNTRPGDIIFLYLRNWLSDVIPSLNLIESFDPPCDYKEIFVDDGHINELGYKILAERYFKYLTENNFFRDVCFNYPAPPPPDVSQIWYTSSIRAGRLNQFQQFGVGELQTVA